VYFRSSKKMNNYATNKNRDCTHTGVARYSIMILEYKQIMNFYNNFRSNKSRR